MEQDDFKEILLLESAKSLKLRKATLLEFGSTAAGARIVSADVARLVFQFFFFLQSLNFLEPHVFGLQDNPVDTVMDDVVHLSQIIDESPQRSL